MTVESEIVSWLAKHNSTHSTNIKNILSNEKASTYLLVWSTFEQKVFDGFMKFEKLELKAKEIEGLFECLELEDISKKFFDRYQNKKFFKNLRHSQSAPEIEKILAQEYEKLTNRDKLVLLFFVAYRYRNNIFHGNKGVLSWVKYTEQIKDCIYFMVKVVDALDKGGHEHAES